MIKLLKISLCVFGLVLLAAGVSTSATPASAGSIRFVTTGGYDGYDCLTPATACGTINGALAKATASDTIEVSAETYYGYGEEVVYINKDISLSGGWDPSFTNRIGRTTIDGQNMRQGIEIVEGVSASIEYLTVLNGFSSSYAGGIANWGTLNLDNSIIQNNRGVDPYAGGIYSSGTLTMTRSTVRNNVGTSINILNGPLSISDSTISGNTAGPGVRIYKQNASIINSTISGNESPFYTFFGGGIYYKGMGNSTLSLRNVTITGNRTENSGGGIFMDDLDGGQLLIANSILAGNSATTGADCSGPITSQGYNIIGDTVGCTLSSTSGDQLNVYPKIAPLSYNGGPTNTQRLYVDSPAIDAGNPDGCSDPLGNLLTTDQRGFPRPLDGNGDGLAVCDVGAYEHDPSVVINSQFLPVIHR
jgi:hypothetical protein